MLRNKNKLQFLFIGWFLTMLILLIIFFPEDRPIRLDKVNFHVAEPEELFFKNVRSYYYDFEKREDANFHLYRIKTRNKDTTKPGITFFIANNWLNDEAYIMVEPNSAVDTTKSLEVRYAVSGSDWDTISLNTPNSYNNYLFAGKIYLAMTEDARFEILNGGETREIFGPENRPSVKKTLKDYFKLVGKMP
jgi:hypothetical protein